MLHDIPCFPMNSVLLIFSWTALCTTYLNLCRAWWCVAFNNYITFKPSVDTPVAENVFPCSKYTFFYSHNKPVSPGVFVLTVFEPCSNIFFTETVVVLTHDGKEDCIRKSCTFLSTPAAFLRNWRFQSCGIFFLFL